MLCCREPVIQCRKSGGCGSGADVDVYYRERQQERLQRPERGKRRRRDCRAQPVRHGLRWRSGAGRVRAPPQVPKLVVDGEYALGVAAVPGGASAAAQGWLPANPGLRSRTCTSAQDSPQHLQGGRPKAAWHAIPLLCWKGRLTWLLAGGRASRARWPAGPAIARTSAAMRGHSEGVKSPTIPESPASHPRAVVLFLPFMVSPSGNSEVARCTANF